jgi:NADPH-dependent F420 reductase
MARAVASSIGPHVSLRLSRGCGTLYPDNEPEEYAMSIGIVGAGNMGASIATQLAKTGEPVTVTDRNPGKAESVVAGIAGDGVSAADMSAALAADVVVLALWYPGTTDFAGEHAAELDGKIVVDISNPLDESWIRLATEPSTSSAEQLAERLPASRIVKAFNTTHAPALADGQVDGVPLDVLLAGDDEAAKAEVGELVKAAGLRPIDAGRLDNARLLERLTAFQIELSQRYGLDFRLAFKLLPAELST